jgi:predicted Zn-dependent protease
MEMNRDEYLRLIREGGVLAFDRDDLAAGASRYADAFKDLGPGEVAFSDHHGEYSSVLWKLGRREDALTQGRLALQAATQEYATDPDSSSIAFQRYSLGEMLVEMGRPNDALETVTPSLKTQSKVAALLAMVQAQALHALGRMPEARAAAVRATTESNGSQRERIGERLRSILDQA